MDFNTKEHYRNKIKELSKKTKLSEIYITNKALDLALENYYTENALVDTAGDMGEQGHPPIQSKKSHIGYYLISYGIDELRKSLVGIVSVSDQKKNKVKDIFKIKAKQYVLTIYLSTIILSVIFGIYINYLSRNIAISIISVILAIIPISEICIQVINYILNKKVEPRVIPKLDLLCRNSKRVINICNNSDYD